MENTENKDVRRLSISEMAQIHKLSRQTLIYYDKIGLFKPYTVESNGYRYYLPTQIPKLREICFLRSIGMPLEEIKKHNVMNSSISTVALLTDQKASLEREIARLNGQFDALNERLALYAKVKDHGMVPYIKHFDDRFIVYGKITGKPSRETLQNALMDAVNLSENASVLPTSLYGTLFKEASVKKGKPLEDACAGFVIDEVMSKRLLSFIKLPAGEYLCLKKYGMSYNLTILNQLLDWMKENGYEITGDIYEESLMDGGLYDNPNELDFSEIQIPVRKKTNLTK